MTSLQFLAQKSQLLSNFSFYDFRVQFSFNWGNRVRPPIKLFASQKPNV